MKLVASKATLNFQKVYFCYCNEAEAALTRGLVPFIVTIPYQSMQ